MEKGKDEYEHNSTMLYVRNLDDSVTDEELYEHVNQFPGLVVSCERAKISQTDKSPGDGFVNYSNPDQAANAIRLLDSTLLKNKPIRVAYSPCHRNRDESLLSITVPLDSTISSSSQNFDKSLDESTLYQLFSMHGDILSFLVSTDASGLRAFVRYKSFAFAQTAIEQLDGVIINNKPLQVLPMRRNCRKLHPELLSVTFTSYNSSASKSFLRNFFSMYGPIASVDDYTHHKGDRFGLITFENPEDAARAARDAPNHNLFNQYFKVSGQYADAGELLDEDIKQLHVTKLHKAITDYSLKALFFSYGCLLSCKVLRDLDGTSTGSGLVTFATNKEAVRALRAMNGKMILGKRLCIILEKKTKSGPKILTIPMTSMTPQTPLPPPVLPPLTMPPPRGFLLDFGRQMFTPGGFGQQMFYGQMAPPLFSPEPGYWYQQQAIPGVTLPAGAPMPNTFVPQGPLLLPGMKLGAEASMPNSWCEIQMENLYPRFTQL
ncbi:hypothetical protein POM88_034049 [Heracleum sosnowskyi]|uniref:RRM domain-containing protein n=1 Tax=Heracleum sosnowskyi TaxID=360622 RepID=A0AAD8HII5_9APIA|nr:hypothetical protein POM88_034049 [Heracleum sosnowskyi]